MSAQTMAPGGEPPPGARASWVEARVREMPHLVTFLYQVLIDPHVEWRFKFNVFATLRYLFDDVPSLIPDDDPLLRRLDDVCMVFCCLAELGSTMPPAFLAYYEEVLHGQDIDVRRLVYEAPWYIGRFYFGVQRVYPPHVERLAELAGNAIKTGELVRKLRRYVATHEHKPWSAERRQRVDVFLRSYRG